MAEPSRAELPIIEATLDLIRWFIPLLNRLPRSHKFALGSEITQALYGLCRKVFLWVFQVSTLGACGARPSLPCPSPTTYPEYGRIKMCRSAYRNNNHPANANNNIGFRVCCLPRAPFIARSAGRDSRG
jgi:hypothetical protein